MAKLERNKIDYKTRKCVLLGFGKSEGYHLYDVICMEIVYSRDLFYQKDVPDGLNGYSDAD